MFRRDHEPAKSAAAAVADAISPYAERFAHDPKVRMRLAKALRSSAAARERVRRQTGWTGAARRLASDVILWRQLGDAYAQLHDANERVVKQRHRRRGRMLILLGGGAVALVATRAYAGRKRRAADGAGSIEESIDVSVPVSTAYNQWTQFEEFPKFMEGVDEVKQLDDTLLHWAVNVAGKPAEWDARIVEQEPDRRIAWESVDGKRTRGAVTFEPLGAERTRVRLSMSYKSDDPLEYAGSALGLDDRRVRGDLERFRELIESRETESGAWRGTVRGGQTSNGAS
jgi:uncharacterized membrane protein